MTPQIAIIGFGIMVLFLLDRDPQVRTSKALWIPIAWLLIAASRNVSEWFQTAPRLDSGDPYLEGSPLDRYVLTGLLVLGVIALFMRRRQIWLLLRANTPILLYFLYCGVSILWSDYPDVSFKRWIRALGDLVMVLVVLSDPHPLTALKRLLARAGFVLLPLSVLLIRYYPDLGRAYSWDGTPGWTGVTTSKNLLGTICLIFGLASAWRFLKMYGGRKGTRRAGPLIAHGILLAMSLWFIWKANSVTSFACFLLAGGVMFVASRPELVRKPAFLHLFVAAELSVAFSALFLNIGSGLLENMGRDATLTGRTAIWSQVLNMSGNPMFGTGYETFWVGPRLEKMWTIYYNHVNQAHNGYLEVFLNLGWLGVGLLAVVLITGYRSVASAVRRQESAGGLRLAYFVVAVAYNFTEAAFKMMHPVWIAFLLAITVSPEPSVPEDLSPLDLRYIDSSTDCRPHVELAAGVGLRKGAN